MAVRDDNISQLTPSLMHEETMFHVLLSETALACLPCERPPPAFVLLLLCCCWVCPEGSDENFPRMIDADSKPLFVTVSTAVTKPEHPTLLCTFIALCYCRCLLLLPHLVRGDDLPLLVRVSYSRFRRLDCRETGSLISCLLAAAAAAAWLSAAC